MDFSLLNNIKGKQVHVFSFGRKNWHEGIRPTIRPPIWGSPCRNHGDVVGKSPVVDDIGRLLQELMWAVALTLKVGVTTFAVDEVKSQPFQLEVLAVGVNKVAKDKP